MPQRPSAPPAAMREPLIVRCGGVRGCHEWIPVEERDSLLIRTPATRFVVPGQARAEDIICDIRRGYWIVKASKAARP
jgi:hypothetical protein